MRLANEGGITFDKGKTVKKTFLFSLYDVYRIKRSVIINNNDF